MTESLPRTPCCAEYQFCSRRGICDFETGRCDCAEGFSKANCDVSDYQITEDFDADVLELYTTLSNFTGEKTFVNTRVALKARTSIISHMRGQL